MAYNIDVFRYQYVHVYEFVWHLWQYRELERQLTPALRQNNFLQLSSGAHMRQAVIAWSKVFGGFSEKTHWQHLGSKDSTSLRKSFRDGLRQATGMSLNEWETYAATMRKFRSTYVVHTDVHVGPQPIPQFDRALAVACYYDEWVRALIAPDEITGLGLRAKSEEVRERAAREIGHLLASCTQAAP